MKRQASLPRIVRLAPLALCIVLVTACASDAGIKKKLTTAIAAGGTVDLVQVVASRWDRVCILGPKTPLSNVKAIFGFEWTGARREKIDQKAAVQLVAFIHNNRVARYVMFPEANGRLPYAQQACYDRNQSTFSVSPGGGVPTLTAVTAP